MTEDAILKIAGPMLAEIDRQINELAASVGELKQLEQASDAARLFDRRVRVAKGWAGGFSPSNLFI